MTRIAFLAGALVAGIVTAGCAASSPVLLDTSFEETAAGRCPEGWDALCEEPNSVAVVDTMAHTGRQSLHLVDTSETLACSLRSPRMPVRSGQDYSVTWWFRAERGYSGSLYVEFWDRSGKRLAGDDLHSLPCRATGQWERHAAIVTAPAAAVGVTVLPTCWSGGKTDAYYDDVTLVEGIVPPIMREEMPPAPVTHPCGLYRAEDVARARENIRRHQWARDLLQEFRERATFWMELPDEQIPFWVPEETPFRVMDCPRCKANWDYAWRFLPPDTLECTRCGLHLPDPAYPEEATETYVNPVGQRVTMRYHAGPQGEKFRISGRLRYQRILRLTELGALGKVYALTGETAYAEKAAKVLRRVAEVYPGYLPHDWNRIYADYSNLQSGKLSGWKLHDAQTFLQMGICYDLICDSGVLTDADKRLIENGAFRECARLLTATSPRGTCINDGPYAMACGAQLGVMLADHEVVKWAIGEPDGFPHFVRRYFFRDGFWEDGTFSYTGMALGSLYACPEILQGYSDPASYTAEDRYDNLDLLADPLLRKIYVAPLRVLMPDRTGPPISDSAVGATYPRRHAETNYRWYPTARSERILAHVYDGKFGDEGDEYALFRRDPNADLGAVEPLDPAARSLVQPGVGWAILRAGEGRGAAAVYLKYGVYGSGHGHPDKLNFIFYDQEAELICDQGYLGARHEISPWNRSTLCHNVVLVDGQAQKAAAGELLAFAPGALAQTAVARGEAAVPGADRYERALTLVDHGVGRRYLVDMVRVAGGQRHDYVIHGAGQDFVAPPGDWHPFSGDVADPKAGGKWVRSAETATSAGPVTARWQEAGKGVRLDLLTPPGTQVLHLTAPGQRHRADPWEQRTLHLLMARRPGPENVFLSVLQAGTDPDRDLHVTELPVAGAGPEARAVQVTGDSFADVLALAPDDALARCDTPEGELRFRGQQALVSRSGQKTTLWLVNGSGMQFGDLRLICLPELRGRVRNVDRERFTLDVECPGLPDGTLMAGQQLLATGLPDGAYEIERVEGRGQLLRVTLADEPLIGLEPGQEFAITTFAEVTVGPGGRVQWRGNAPCQLETKGRTYRFGQ
ncbi:MAG: hypothetical protein HPY69_08320 [Armatimonadetes bacterium]|nr:hypothetical protein [Armatimonadota bacterium]